MAATRRKTLGVRVAGLERRVDGLTGRVDVLETRTGVRAKEVPPAKAEASVLRCPGCSLQVEPPVGARCQWCGFVFAAARPRRTRR